MSSLAPIALFVYKRPEHTRKTIESLIRNREFIDSSFYVFCDGPRSSLDIESIQKTRAVVKSFKINNITLIEQSKNLGLAKSIIAGVTDICNRFDRVIVLEDDLVVSPFFLEYMNQALDKYECNPEVMQISGHMFPVKLDLREDDALFLPFATSWGWATWNNCWKQFDVAMSSSVLQNLKTDKYLANKFNLDGSYPYFKILNKHFLREVDSWAIVWYSSIFMLEGLVLYPSQTLVKNIGLDGSGEHCGKILPLSDSVSESQENMFFRVVRYPNSLSINNDAFSKIKKFLRRRTLFKIISSVNNFLSRLKNII